MNIRCGTDLVRIERIVKAYRRLGDPFLRRIWTREELDACLPGGCWRDGSAASLAARFAAKEAMAKALGTGIGRQGICWTDLVVRTDGQGAPRPVLQGAANDLFSACGGLSQAISLSHEGDYAQAFCVMLFAGNPVVESE